MTIQRAVVKGTLFSTVQVRNMFTCDVVESGGDTFELLWTTYLESIYSEVIGLAVDQLVYYSYELQNYSAGQWVPFDEVDFDWVGENNLAALPNAVAVVLLGKASGLRHVGRKFFSGITENQSDGNALFTTSLAVAASALLAYITPFTGIGGGTITPGIVDGSGTFHPFVGGVVSTLLGSMRRRKPGLGI